METKKEILRKLELSKEGEFLEDLQKLIVDHISQKELHPIAACIVMANMLKVTIEIHYEKGNTENTIFCLQEIIKLFLKLNNEMSGSINPYDEMEDMAQEILKLQNQLKKEN